MNDTSYLGYAILHQSTVVASAEVVLQCGVVCRLRFNWNCGLVVMITECLSSLVPSWMEAICLSIGPDDWVIQQDKCCSERHEK